MSASSQPDRSSAPRAQNGRGARVGAAGDERPHDGLPVLADQAAVLGVRPLGAAVSRSSPALAIGVAQAAVAAASGFVAGAAVVGLVHRRQRRAALTKPRGGTRQLRRSQGGARAPGRTAELVQIVGRRSLLVDVHLLGER